MKHYFLIWLSLLLLNSSAFAQSNEDKLAFVRKHFYAIENSLNELIEKAYIYKPHEYPPWGYYKFWFNDAGELLKATYTIGEEGYATVDSYYFNKGKLYFAFTEDFERAEYMEQQVSETRVYLYNEKLFKALYRTQSDEDSRPIEKIEQKELSVDAERESACLEKAKEFIKYSKMAE